MRLRTLAPAKINVCLYLGPVRDDGRHELVSVMQSVSLADRVTLEHADGVRDEVVSPGSRRRRTSWPRALAGLRTISGWSGPAVRVTVDKRIPVAAGMAGGSADAGAALRLARARGRRHRRTTSCTRSLRCSAPTCPPRSGPDACWPPAPATSCDRVPGVSPYAVVVVPDRDGLATADVFREADRLGLPRDAASLAEVREAVLAALPDLPDELCVNELEPAALSLRPDLAERLAGLRAAGADVALVSGSGPTTLGLFRDEQAARAAAERFPRAVVARPVGPDTGEVLAA